MRHLGDPGVFVAWRAAGVALLVFGFWALASFLPRRRERLLALALFCFGGGFGWLMQAAQAAGVRFGQFAFVAADQSWGIQPFLQMLQNPHFAAPHGLVLIALALLVVGERTGRTSAYAAAGVAALLACASRPYDLVAFAIVIPGLQLFSGHVMDLRRAAQRALTLLLLSPACVSVLVIWHNPNFRTWATQGVMPVIPLAAYPILLGLPLIVVAWRVIRERRFPFATPEERVLSLWAVAVLLLSQANRFTAALANYPQILVTSMAPLVLLAIPAIARGGEAGERWSRAWIALAALALALPSSVIVMVKSCRAASHAAGLVSDGERLGWEWLAREVQPSDLILATAESGNRLPRHVPAHVSAGQWALTPDHLERAAEAEAFFSGRLDPEEAARYLRDWGVDWVWVGPAERDLGGWVSASFAPGCQLRYKRLGVRIYRCS